MTLDTTLRELIEAGVSGVAGVTIGQLLSAVAVYAGLRMLLWVGRAVMAPDKPEPAPSDD